MLWEMCEIPLSAMRSGNRQSHSGWGERRVKWNRVRTQGPHPIIADESRGVRLADGETARATLYCLAPAPIGGSASVGLTWVAPVCQACPAALTV